MPREEKKVVQDVIPKRSIRDIELPKRKTLPRDQFTKEVKIHKKTEKTEKVEQAEPKTKPKKEIPSYTYEYDIPKKSKGKGKYIAAGILIVALAFGVSALFKGATIRITPKEDTKTINETFTAKKDVPTGLTFQVVTTSKEMDKSVDATAEENVVKKASGKIVVYNNTSSAQTLVTTTRFQTPEGLIFRLQNAVTVPARRVVDGKNVAGSLEAIVSADKPGADYNIGLKDFTIPGFKGDPKYTQIYGRSKTPMTGGFSGLQKVVSKEIMTQVDSELDGALKDSLARDITSQIPSNFVLYKETLSYSFDPVSQVDSSSGKAVLRKKGKASALILDRGLLTQAILSKILPEETNNPIKITNLENLTFTYPGATPDINLAPVVSFTLQGNPHFVWIFDENKLKSDLLGLSKKTGKAVIATYPSIKEAWIETRPFWNTTIPTNPKKVTLVNTLEN